MDYVDAAITTILQVHLQEGTLQGDMLVFLTGPCLDLPSAAYPSSEP